MTRAITIMSVLAIVMYVAMCPQAVTAGNEGNEMTQSAMSAPQTRSFRMGFTPFPWDYGEEIRERSLRFVSTQGGDIICHHCDHCLPWPEAIANEPVAAAVEANWEGHPDKAFNTTDPVDYLPEHAELYLALTPLNMGRNGIAGDRRGTAPKGFTEKEFDDPEVKRAYLNYCRSQVEHFDPDYLAIGIEVNELLSNAPDKWPHLVNLYRYVYDELKKDHPDLPIFASMTLHSILNRLTQEPATAEMEVKKLKEFLAYNDIVAISFYSFLGTIGEPEQPTAAFEWLRDFAGDKPIAITETGFPAEATDNPTWPQWPGNPEAQTTYLETLLKYATRDNYRFITVFLHRDYDLMWEKLKATRPAWQGAWKDIGLLDGDGSARPAWHLWQRYLSLELKQPE